MARPPFEEGNTNFTTDTQNFFLPCIVKQNEDLNKENPQHSLFRCILPNTQIFSEYVQYNETVKTRLR
jgi:hypothetical protein